jgi:hypothetical protein
MANVGLQFASSSQQARHSTWCRHLWIFDGNLYKNTIMLRRDLRKYRKPLSPAGRQRIPGSRSGTVSARLQANGPPAAKPRP